MPSVEAKRASAIFCSVAPMSGRRSFRPSMSVRRDSEAKCSVRPTATPSCRGHSQQHPPVIDQKAGDSQENLCLQGQMTARHRADETRQLRHQIDHQKQEHGQDDGQSEGGIDEQLLEARAQLVAPLQRIRQLLEGLRNIARLLARANQGDEGVIEDLRIGGERIGELRTGLDGVDHRSRRWRGSADARPDRPDPSGPREARFRPASPARDAGRT